MRIIFQKLDTIEKLKILGIIVFFFFFGIVLSMFSLAGEQQEVATNTATGKPTPTTTMAKIQTWQALKAIDDRLISSCSQNFQVVTDIFNAQAKLDFTTVKQKNNELDAGVAVANQYADERNKILQELGY